MSPDHYSPWVQAGEDHTAGSLLSPSTHLPLVSVLLFFLSLFSLILSLSLFGSLAHRVAGGPGNVGTHFRSSSR